MNVLITRELALLNFAPDDLRVVRLVFGGLALLAAFVAFVSASGLSPHGTRDVGRKAGGRSYLNTKIAAGLACVPLIGGIVFLHARDSFVRFYAMQSIIFGAAWFLFSIVSAVVHAVFGAIPDIGGILLFFWAIIAALAQLAFLVVLIIAIVKAVSGVPWDIPYIGPVARRRVGDV